MESAGADRGVLLLEKAGEWQIEAFADLNDARVEIGFADKARYRPRVGVEAGVPFSVVNYVVRMQASVTVNEPVRDLRFGQDAYITSVVPRSILCVPVVNQGRTTGIIYLENKLGPDVFSADRRDLIDVLAGQIAISLENAALYADLKNTVMQQEQMLEKVALQQAELGQINNELVEQKSQLSKQAAELRTRNDEINVVSMQWKMAEEETRGLNAELEKRVQDRTAELQRSNEELEQFAYVASHDLQEPLRKISSFAQLLAAQYKDKLDADANEFIAYMVDGARRMQALIQNLLAYSRLGQKGKPFALADGDAVLKQALINLQGAIEDCGAVVTCDPLPTVLANEVQLVQLFQNLIGNAIKFRGVDKPLVHVRAEPNGPAWTFSVRDNGIGIDPQFAERIFVIFQRLHIREEYPGTGIGLAFCKKIVERHSGRIWMESQPGHGTTFRFTLPRSREMEQPTHELANER
jgi:signal transduction histidine kinase